MHIHIYTIVSQQIKEHIVNAVKINATGSIYELNIFTLYK